MPLTYRDSKAASSGGLALSVSIVAPNTIQAGDLIVWTVLGLENTRGWGGGIDGTGSLPQFTDLSTAPAAVVLNGRSQYEIDNGGQRMWWWIGYRIATVADTLTPTYTASLVSSPAAGVGMACALDIYTNPGGSVPIYSEAASLNAPISAGTQVVAPATATPPGSAGPYTFTISATASSDASAQTTAIFGSAGDYHVLTCVVGLGGTGVWAGPAPLTDRLRFGGPGGPWYMITFSDGPTAGSLANLGRLPLLGAG